MPRCSARRSRADALAAISGVDGEALDGSLRSLVKREILEDLGRPPVSRAGALRLRPVGHPRGGVRDALAAGASGETPRGSSLLRGPWRRGAGRRAGQRTSWRPTWPPTPGPRRTTCSSRRALALRAAADRAVTLGAADQAVTWLLQALSITEASPERGDILERAAKAAVLGARYDDAESFARQAIVAYEEVGDRSAVARVSALLGGILADASKIVETIAFLEAALADADALEDIEIRADMLARLSRAHMRLGQYEASIRAADEALAIAEPRRLDRIVAEALVNKGSSLGFTRRIREPVLLLRGGMEIAAQMGDNALVLRARNNLASSLLGEDLPVALREILDAYELATRLGVSQMAQWLAGTYAYGAHFAGSDWDGPLALLDGELERSRSDADRGRLLQVRAFLMAWRGEDTAAVIAERDRYQAAVSDPDVEAWTFLFPAWSDLVAGRYRDAVAGFRQAIPLAVQNQGDAHIGLIRAALLGRDLEAAREGLRHAESENWVGRYVDAERALAEAGIAALEGRTVEALAAFRRAVDMATAAGALFDVALVQLCALTMLPGEPSIAAWAQEARERFEIVKSPPLLERLEEAISARVA